MHTWLVCASSVVQPNHYPSIGQYVAQRAQARLIHNSQLHQDQQIVASSSNSNSRMKSTTKHVLSQSNTTVGRPLPFQLADHSNSFAAVAALNVRVSRGLSLNTEQQPQAPRTETLLIEFSSFNRILSSFEFDLSKTLKSSIIAIRSEYPYRLALGRWAKSKKKIYLSSINKSLIMMI